MERHECILVYLISALLIRYKIAVFRKNSIIPLDHLATETQGGA